MVPTVIKPAPRTIFRMINGWIMIPICLFVMLQILSSDLRLSGRIGGGVAFLVACLLFQGIRVIRILGRLPDHVMNSDISDYFRADFAHHYFSVGDVASGITALANRRRNNGEQGVAPQPAPRSESDFSGSLPPST